MSQIKKSKSTIILILLLLIIFSQFLYLIFNNWEKFFLPGYSKNYESYKNAYYSSQYAVKNSKAIIPDEIFEDFAAGAFLKGLDPINIVHDHPPLGRYILSLSIILFDNPNTIVIFCLVLSFLGVYLISGKVIDNKYLKLLPLAIFVNEPLTLNKLIYTPLPEPVQLPFIIFSIYFFLESLNKRDKRIYYILVSILLGCVISIRFFVTGGVILGTILFFLFIIKRNFTEGFKFLLYLPLSLLVLFLSYTRTIRDGYNIFGILKIQKYILSYHKSAFTNAFSFWDLIIFNRWHTWWGEKLISSDPQWNIFWPASVVFSFLGMLLALLKRFHFSDSEKIIAVYTVFYSLMLSTGYTATRYFFPLMPFLYILSVSVIIKIYSLYYGSHKK